MEYKQPLTFLQAIWLILLTVTIYDYHWALLIILILFFPKWPQVAQWADQASHEYNVRKMKRKLTEEQDEQHISE